MSDSHPPLPDALVELATRCLAADGCPPFSDGALVGLATGANSVEWLEGSAAAIVSAPDAVSGAAVVEVEFAVDPDARGRGLGTAMLERLQRAHPAGLLVWTHGDHPAARALAASHGLEPVRELWHLSTRSLAVRAGAPAGPPAAAIGFREADEAELLDLNARAFAHHPEQGRLTAEEFRVLRAAPWFADDDLLLVRDPDNARLIGFCWLKVEGERGEFYAVGVSPERQGEGWGRRLMGAGLSRLAVCGIREAHLYVEGDNEPAVGLYRSLGFERDAVDVQYRWAGAAS